VFGHDLHARVGALGPRYDVFPVGNDGPAVVQLRDTGEWLEGPEYEIGHDDERTEGRGSLNGQLASVTEHQQRMR
jgi:hypothetical protein